MKRMFYGWWIVILGCLINAVGMGILYQSFTIFFLPLKRDLAVSSAAISLLFGAARLEGGIEGPVVGYLISRLGCRTMVLAGASMAGCGLILLATTHSFWPFFFIYVFIVSLGFNAGFFHPLSTAVNNWFIRHRGIGFAAITASGGIGGMIMAPFLSYLILTYGWRTGAVAAGIIILIVSLPAAIPMRHSPEMIGLRPDGDASSEAELEASKGMRPNVEEPDFTVKEALGTRTYWILMGAISLRLSVTVALNTHLAPILVWKGVSEANSAYLVSLFAFSNIISMPILGWIGDRWNKSLLCCLCILPTVIVMLGLSFNQAGTFVYLLPMSMAITMANAPLNWALIGDFFGRKAYATLRGIMGICYGTATFVSPIYAGWIYDNTGSYEWVLITFSIILMVAGACFFFLRNPSLSKTKKDISDL
jgi:MFS family permease